MVVGVECGLSLAGQGVVSVAGCFVALDVVLEVVPVLLLGPLDLFQLVLAVVSLMCLYPPALLFHYAIHKVLMQVLLLGLATAAAIVPALVAAVKVILVFIVVAAVKVGLVVLVVLVVMVFAVAVAAAFAFVATRGWEEVLGLGRIVIAVLLILSRQEIKVDVIILGWNRRFAGLWELANGLVILRVFMLKGGVWKRLFRFVALRAHSGANLSGVPGTLGALVPLAALVPVVSAALEPVLAVDLLRTVQVLLYYFAVLVQDEDQLVDVLEIEPQHLGTLYLRKKVHAQFLRKQGQQGVELLGGRKRFRG